jgi:magnesium-transporting ATPase (P-type)
VFPLWQGAAVSESQRTDPGATAREKPDQWRDFRRGMALLSWVLFFFCLVAVGFLIFGLLTGRADGTPDVWSVLRFASFATPMGIAALAGIGVYRSRDNAQEKRRGRIVGMSLLIGAILLVLTGVIGDQLS